MPPLASGCESLTSSHGHSANLCRRLHFNTSQTNSNPSGGRHFSSFALGKMFFGSYIITVLKSPLGMIFWLIATFFKLSCCVSWKKYFNQYFPEAIRMQWLVEAGMGDKRVIINSFSFRKFGQFQMGHVLCKVLSEWIHL